MTRIVLCLALLGACSTQESAMEATGGKDLIAHQWDPDIVYEVFGVAEPDAELLKIDVGTGTAGTLCREPDFPPTQIRKMDGTMARVWFFEFRPGKYWRFGEGKFEPLRRSQTYRAGYVAFDWRGQIGVHEWVIPRMEGGPTAINSMSIDIRKRFGCQGRWNGPAR
ncbi:MAG: hypothetical protein H6706_30030 [Myxococcales bacterium]|nr:hypothetical protein [Myxococcales bacterium]